MNERLAAALRWSERWCEENPAPKSSRDDTGYHKQRRARDPAYKAMMAARGRLNTMLLGAMSSHRKRELIGCSLVQLKRHIESQFLLGMTWENRGVVWELDHIIPCRMFNFTRQTDIWKCFHYRNLQPLWKWANRAKGCQVFNEQRLRELYM